MSTRKRANPQPPTKDHKPWLLVAGGVAVVAIVALILVSGGDDEGSFACTPISSFADVHGLAVSPENVSRVYAATHHGLVRGDDGTDWCRVGANQDDLMGFTMHPESGETFWVSGHPRGGGNMGVRQSTDGGYTWEHMALTGVDFHAMTVSPADPDRLWGSFQGKVYRSDDGGNDWTVVADAPGGIFSLAGHPGDAEVAFATTASGLFRSQDGGESWLRVQEVTLTALAVHPGDADTMLAATRDGRVVRSQDGGQQWTPTDFQAPNLGHLTFARANPDVVYAATYSGGIFRSADGGDTWDRTF